MAPKGTKKCKRGLKCGQIKNKKIGLYFQNKNWWSTLVGSKNVFKPDLDLKNSPNRPKEITPKGSKSEKRPKIWLNLKQKDKAILPKQKLIVYISRFQKCF